MLLTQLLMFNIVLDKLQFIALWGWNEDNSHRENPPAIPNESNDLISEFTRVNA